MKSLDIFADEYFQIRLATHYQPGNVCGGLLTIILVTLPVVMFGRGLYDIRNRNPALVDISVLHYYTSTE